VRVVLFVRGGCRESVRAVQAEPKGERRYKKPDGLLRHHGKLVIFPANFTGCGLRVYWH
jgi:hypothetical protein